MQFFASLDAVPRDFGPSAVTVGKFDGVHAGHRGVIAALEEVAADRGLTTTVITFDRHPLSIIRPELCPPSLVSNAQKVELLASTGLDATLMLEFDVARSRQPAEEFVTSVLVETLHAEVVFVGADFKFGAAGRGDVGLLRELGGLYGFEVILIPEVTAVRGRRASSTWVRELLDVGDVAEAATVLGRLPNIRSTVVHGEERGRALGYPTANLSPNPEGLIPADGVYAARATIDGHTYGAAVSIGNNPTFEGVPQKQVEAHLLDQQLDLYDRQIELEFVEYIRSMVRFDSVDALIEQMNRDEDAIRLILGQPRP